jgi:hypothetical protein
VTDERLSFAERRRRLAEQRGRALPEGETDRQPLKTVPPVDDDLVPDVLSSEQSEENLKIDAIIKGMDPISAYRKWIGKKVVEKEVTWQECHISCPIPGHVDAHPSAWILTKPKGSKPRGTWFCGGCQEGGDLYDLAAIGFKVSNYRDGKNFHDLRRQMAESFGYRFKTVSGTEVAWKEDENKTEPGIADDAPTIGATDKKKNPVTVLYAKDVDEDDEADYIVYPVLDWKKLVPEETFLHDYLVATTHDDSPEEYHFWHGCLALGHAVGRNVYLNDTRPVYSNLLVCLLGGTGFGKSRSRYWLDEVIEAALPFHDNGLDTSGCKLVPTPGSGENLINHFQHIAQDPSMGKMPIQIRTPVNGIVDYDEFASLLARSARQGSTLKQIIMGFSDGRTRINTSSNTGGTFEAFEPFCSITASTQPKAIRPLLVRTDTASGFLNRWLFIGGPKKQREVMGGSHSSIKVDLDPAIERLKRVRGWGATTRDVTFSEEALDEYEKFVRYKVFPVQAKDDTDLLTRLDLTMKRLVLIFCINEHKTEVDKELVKRVEPILDYLIACYSILNAEIGITHMQELTTELLRHIKRIEESTGRGASARDLALRLKRKNHSPDLINKALKTMQELDWIDVDKTKGPGRPTIRYKVVAS